MNKRRFPHSFLWLFGTFAGTSAALFLESVSGGFMRWAVSFPLLIGVFIGGYFHLKFSHRLLAACIMGVLLDTFSLLPFGAGLLVMAGLVGLGELLGIVLSDTVPFFKKGIIAGILLSLFFIAGPLMASSINAQPMSQKHAKVSF